MDVTIKFLGGARSVTGSKFLLTVDHQKILIDCGLFQGHKSLRQRNWDSFPVDPATIDTIILTHAHIDHSGYLPRIIKEGFNGLIHCTKATASLLDIMLIDAAKLQEEEAEYAEKQKYSRHKNPQPLFNTQDAEAALALIQGHDYKKQAEIADGIKATFHHAGHILGASIIALEIKGEKDPKKIVFSGDLGRYNSPMLHDPATIKEADVLFVESTYGDRSNTNDDIKDSFVKAINDALERKAVF